MEQERKVALVTGASRRIGASIASRLALGGYDLLAHYRSDRAGVESLRADALALGARVEIAQRDLSDRSTSRKLIDQARENFGRLDLLVNSASIFEPTPAEGLGGEELDRFMEVNLIAPTLLALEASKLMREAPGSGAVVNVIDLYADFGLRFYTAYTISKGALSQMTRQLALDLAPEIRVNGISPGAILEPAGGSLSAGAKSRIIERIPLGRFGSAADVSEAVFFLAGASYITGVTLRVDGGRAARI